MKINFKMTANVSGIAMLLVLMFGIGYAQKPYNIKGQIGLDKNGKIYLAYNTEDDKFVNDSAMVKDGAFTLTGKITAPVYANLVFFPANINVNDPLSPRDAQELFIDPTEISLSSSSGISQAVIKGGKSQTDFNILWKSIDFSTKKTEELNTIINKYKSENDAEGAKPYFAQAAVMTDSVRKIKKLFIQNHPDSYVSFYLYRNQLRGKIDPTLTETEFKRFSAEIQNSIAGKALTNRIVIAKRKTAGNSIIDFTLPDTLGKPVSISSFKGKNTLVCFWYHNFIPFNTFSFVMNKINRQLKSENFAIVSVFYNMANESNADWKKILADNTFTWTNLIDSDGFQNYQPVSQLAKDYDLKTTMPLAILIGPDGKILSGDVKLEADPVTEIKSLLKK